MTMTTFLRVVGGHLLFIGSVAFMVCLNNRGGFAEGVSFMFPGAVIYLLAEARNRRRINN